MNIRDTGLLVLALTLADTAVAPIQPADAQDILGQTGVKGAGSTFIYPLLSKWSNEYLGWLAGEAFRGPNTGLDEALPGSALEYEPIGSLGGVLRVTERAVDFGISDMPFTSEELADRGLAQFPIVIGGVVAAFNVDGVGRDALRVSGPVLAQIFLGTINRWSDPAIKALNPSLNLPDAAISVIHRSDGSGTTFNFTQYLSKVSPEWKEKAGSGLRITWPTGTGAKGNEGVARAVKSAQNSIGYVEYAQATQLNVTYALIQNRAGIFAKPSTASFHAATLDADWSKPRDFNVLLVDSANRDAYPITAMAFALMPKKASGSATKRALNFFRWSLEHGSSTAYAVGYVPLPPTLARQVTAYWTTALGVKTRPPGVAAAKPRI